MTLNISKKSVLCLEQNPGKKFEARDIAKWIFENYPDECREKQQRSKATVTPIDTDEKLIQQMAAEISARRPDIQKKNPKIKTIEDHPRKYYYTESSDSRDIEEAVEESGNAAILPNSKAITEHDLYPVLTQFMWSEFGIYSKRIDEKYSRNAQGAGSNRWLYPDLVAMEDLSKDWHREIKNFVKEYADKKTILWSFEVKKEVRRSNVREMFFQAVSNSSWANLGYLVAGQIEGANTLKELRILSSLHGIGVIGLDIDDPSESQIIIPAKQRPEIDWNNANRIAEENKDFMDYVKLVRQFYQTGDINAAEWDAVEYS